MLITSKEKKERALGVRLGLKPYRCESPKCVMIRHPQRPGMHGKSRRRAPSEYGAQLLEKQKLMVLYGVRDTELRKIFGTASRMAGSSGVNVLALLERRLNNVVYRLGLAPSRIVARQIVSHGHILVNGRRTRVPSYETQINDAVSIRPASMNLLIFKELKDTLKKKEPPAWLLMDAEKLEGKIIGAPSAIETPFDINAVVDYYSK